MATLTFWQGMSGNGLVIYCRADEGRWKQVSKWMRELGDWGRWASGGQVENGSEQVCEGGNVAGGRDREAECDKYILFSWLVIMYSV